VKTLVYHTLGTLMPYPSEDPPRDGGFFLIDGCSVSAPHFISLKEGGILSIYSPTAQAIDQRRAFLDKTLAHAVP